MASTYATDIFNGNGSTDEFDLTFPFISRDHVRVTRIEKADGAETVLTVIETGTPVGDEYRWENDTRIKVGTAPSADQQIRIRRDTPENQQLVPWADGSYLISEDLNTSDLQWLYGLQELEDKFGLLQTSAIKYLGAIDLTVDEAPATPTGGDFFINTGAGTVIASWTGIAGDTVVGAEQVIYSATDFEWQIFDVPSSQQGVVQVTGTSPIAIDNTDTQRPDVSITPATTSAAGSMSAADKAKLDGLPADAEANVNADWNAASGDAEILNKPSIPAAQVNSDWDATSGVAEILNKPTIPAAQVNSDWDATTGVAEILNKPDVIDGDAPSDGNQYARQNQAWSVVTGGGGGGVTQIVAGNNVTISPAGGTGVVTVNSTGGGGGGTTKADIYGTAKAWASVQNTQTNGLQPLLASYNIASVTRTAVGDLDVVFSTPMPSSDYVVTTSIYGGGSFGAAIFTAKSTTGFTIKTGLVTSTNTPNDYSFDFTVHDDTPAEIIVGSGTVANTNIYGTAKAWGDAANDGVLSNGFNCTTAKTATGTYSVTFTSPLPSDKYTVVASTGNTSVKAATGSYTANGFVLFTTNVTSGSVPQDSSFSFTVHDNTPAEVALTTFGDVINYSGPSAWGELDDSGNLIAGQNIASVTRTGVGLYEVVLATPLGSNDYSVVAASSNRTVASHNSPPQTANGFTLVVLLSSTSGLADIASGYTLSFTVHSTNSLPPKGGTGTDAWAEFNGASGTSDADRILASYNINTITRTAAGTYDVTFTVPMPTANYAVPTVNAAATSRTTAGFTLVNYSLVGSNSIGDASSISFTVHATNAQLPNTVTQEQIESAINNPGASAWALAADDGTLVNGLNIASITRTGTGKYSYVFRDPLPSANYSITGASTSTNSSAANGYVSFANLTATGFDVNIQQNGTYTDRSHSLTVHATNALPPKGGTGADAWCTPDGTGFNIASVVQSGGNGNNWTVTFTTPMPSDVYAVVATPVTTASGTCFIRNRTSTGFQVVTRDYDGSNLALGWTAVVHATNAQLPATLTQDMLVMKAGDTMTGALNVPAGASGTEAPQVQEVVQKTGDTMTGDLRVGGSTFAAGGAQFSALHTDNITGTNPDPGVDINPAGVITAARVTANINPAITVIRNGDAADRKFIEFKTNDTSVGKIDYAGSATVRYVTVSDYRLKENVAGIDNVVSKLQALKPCNFNFISDPDEPIDGFIAHELQAVVPNAVSGTKDAVDEEGKPEYQGIDTSKLVPLLTAALQEALTRIETLEAKVQTLENN